MRIVDARRLRGPSLGASGPGAMVEVALERGETPRRASMRWRRTVEHLLTLLRLRPLLRDVRVRTFAGGLALFVPAPVDLLDAMLELSEWAVGHATRSMKGTSGLFDADEAFVVLRRRFVETKRLRLRRLADEAARRHRPFLFDDDRVTIGYAKRSRTYAVDALPLPGEVPWMELARIPVALVTGTNGKTTTTRLVARIAKLAGLVPGVTSSDGIAIDEVLTEPGDNTGGESARTVLRDPRVQIAILETARGGLLRRGLAVRDVDAALITNVTADHLGEHGVFDLKTLVETKAVVGRAVRRGGRVVLSADDPSLVRIARRFGAKRVWFAVGAASARWAIARGEPTFTIERGAIVRIERDRSTTLVGLDDVPLADHGAAPHNVKNALAAAALAWSLGLADEAVIAGLKTFGAEAADNPGRGQVLTTAGGVRVVLDFGHNPAAASDLYAWARALAGAQGRVHAVLTQPGDRTNAAMIAFAKAVAKAGASSTVVWEAESLLRGRAPGEITKRLVLALKPSKVAVRKAKDEASAIRAALAKARRGDVVVVSPSLDRALPR